MQLFVVEFILEKDIVLNTCVLSDVRVINLFELLDPGPELNCT